MIIHRVDNKIFTGRIEAEKYAKFVFGEVVTEILEEYSPSYEKELYIERSVYLVITRTSYDNILSKKELVSRFLSGEAKIKGSFEFDKRRNSLDKTKALFEMGIVFSKINKKDPQNGDNLLKKWLLDGLIEGYYYQFINDNEKSDGLVSIYDYLKNNSKEWTVEIETSHTV